MRLEIAGRKAFFRLGFPLLLVLLLSTTVRPVWTQLYSGTITGVIVDPSGAVVPGAAVTATELDRRYTYTATTDATGRYALRAVPPGKYSLAVEARGFDKYVRESFPLDVSTTVTVDAALQLAKGAVAITVTDSSAPQLQTETAALGQTINRKLINDLPLVGRGLFDLVSLAPGVNPPAGHAFGPGNGTATNFVSNGTRNMQSDVVLDGVTVTNTEQNGATAVALYTPTVDSVEEFKVQQGNFSAEYGYTGGATVNAVTRSGSNQFHGSAFFFMRNRATDANDFFANAAGQPLPAVNWHEFGGTVSGPITIPKVYKGRDKTFFFVSYNGHRTKSASTDSGGVPSAVERTGNFGELCGYAGGKFDAAGMCSNPNGQIWDPFTATMDWNAGFGVRQNFIPFNNLKTYMSPGNPASPQGNLAAVPGNLLDPVAAKLAAYYPAPNLNVGSPAYNPYHNWLGTGAAPTSFNNLDFKGDHLINQNNRLSVKYARSFGTSTNGPNLFGNAGDTHTQGFGRGLNQTGVVNYTNTFNANTILTVTVGDVHSWSSNKNLLNSTYSDLSPVTTLGMPAYIATSGYNSFPQTYLSQGYESVGNQAWSNYTTGSETRHLLGSLVRVAGPHEIKAGAELRIHFLNMLFNGEPAGVYNFSQFGSAQKEGWSGGSGGGDAMATFMMGLNDGWGGYEIPIRPAISSKQTGMFVQDNWKVNDKLALNIGVRYDIELPRTERYNRMSYFDPNAPAPALLNNVPGMPNLKGALEYVGVNGNPRTISPIYWGEIQPRLGFAYRLRNDTTLRGGYGIYYLQSFTGLVGLSVTSFNGFSATTNNTNWGADLTVPVSFLRNPYPFGLNIPQGAKSGAGFLLGQQLGAPIPAWNRTPQDQSWSFDLQHQLPWSTLVDVGYVGTKGTHLYQGGVNALDYMPAGAAAAYRANPAAANAQVPDPFYNIIPGAAQSVAQYRLWLPYPQYFLGSNNSPGLTGTGDPRGNSIYHALQIKVEKQFSSGIQFLSSYVWSKSIDDASVPTSGGSNFEGGSSSLQDPNNLHLERSLSQFNIPHVFQIASVFELPFGRGKKFGNRINRLANLALGGWQLNATFRWDDGQPLAISLLNTQPMPTYGGQRPDMLGQLKQSPGVNIEQYFANPGVIGTPAPYTDGTASRTDPRLRAPGTNTLAGSLFKDFPLHFREGARIQFRAEFFNLLNHPQFGVPNTTFGDPNFGKIFSQANAPRTGQLALKAYF